MIGSPLRKTPAIRCGYSDTVALQSTSGATQNGGGREMRRFTPPSIRADRSRMDLSTISRLAEYPRSSFHSNVGETLLGLTEETKLAEAERR